MKKKLLLCGIATAVGAVLIAAGVFFAASGNTFFYTAAMISGAVLLLAGGTALIYFRQGNETSSAGRKPFFRKEGSRPVPEGYIEAQVLGISKGLHLEGEPDSYHVVCRYLDPETKAVLTFSSEALPTYPGKEIIGKKVRVLLRSLDDENYRVDLTSIH